MSLLLAGMPVFAAGQPADSGLDYLSGSYVVIGKHADSEKTYTGRMTVSLAEQVLKIVRVIGGRSTEATGTMDAATPDRIPVLRVSFKEHGKLHEETCMVSSDLDNYPRVSCYVQHNFTKKVGLEAWFSDHGQLRRQ
ncbi:MAG: hypothetical protein PHS32_06925 [Rhodoferax sp.]|uniref:hypothetical protein n=1 Tax=Rhodoferax sp. TaxID=50421 RepID=UPI00260229E1|nr:hypothetical protein [Rhodoferax sp.]MDD5333462.1 hypothetical protein [Rhodoferax sp.]